jgi:hypothetical protein
MCGSSTRVSSAGGSDSSKTGVGAECARKSDALVEAARERALAGDRLRYRAEVLDLGFKIERPR